MKRRLQVFGTILGLLASFSRGQNVETKHGPDGSTRQSAILIPEAAPADSERRQVSYLQQRYPGARLVPDEDEVRYGDSRWTHGRAFEFYGQKHKIYFDVTAASKKEQPRIEGHLVTASLRPQYPAAAAAQKLEGEGVFYLEVARDGTVTNVNPVVSTGHEILDEAARRAFLEWRFKPEGRVFIVKVPCNYRFSPEAAKPSAAPAGKP